MSVVEFVEASEADDPFWLFCRASTSGDSPGFRPADKSTFTSKKKKKQPLNRLKEEQNWLNLRFSLALTICES